jgi:hypothetical protein
VDHPKTDEDEDDPTRFGDEKDDNPKTDVGQGNESHYEDEKDDDSKTEEHEAITYDYHKDTKENEDEGYTNHGVMKTKPQWSEMPTTNLRSSTMQKRSWWSSSFV